MKSNDSPLTLIVLILSWILIWNVCRELFDFYFKEIVVFHALNRLIDLVHANVLGGTSDIHIQTQINSRFAVQTKQIDEGKFISKPVATNDDDDDNKSHRNYCIQICYENEDDMPISSPTESECKANYFEDFLFILFCKNPNFIISSTNLEVCIWKKKTISLEFCIVPWHNSCLTY